MIEAGILAEAAPSTSKECSAGEERKNSQGLAAPLCLGKAGPTLELQNPAAATVTEPPFASGTAESEVAESVEIAAEHPSTSFVKPADPTPPDVGPIHILYL